MFVDIMPNLYTRDLDAALRFYRDLLGLAETYRYPPAGEGPARHVEWRAGATTRALSSDDALHGYGLPPATPGQPAFELAIEAKDTGAAVELLRAAGVPVLREPFDGAKGLRVAYVLDPDGNRVHMYSRG